MTVTSLVETRHRQADATRQAIRDEQLTEAPMPIFDRSVSQPSCAGARLLGSVHFLASLRSPSVHPPPRDDRRRQRRASIMRALVVLTLLGLFCGSAVVTSEKPQPPPDAAPVSPPAAAQGPVRVHAKARPALLVPGPLAGRTYCLWPDGSGEASADERLVADLNTDAGALHAKSC